jgi:hypothetical protein
MMRSAATRQIMKQVFRRLLVASLARSYAAEVMRTAKPRSRRDHLQNGAAALLDIWSEVAWRRDPLSRFYFARGERLRSALRYAIAEFREAAHPQRRTRHTQRLILVAVPTAAALAVAVRARAGRET